ncbi:MAG: T9SS type A sorting domain-containing protein [Chlorobiota bacterium]
MKKNMKLLLLSIFILPVAIIATQAQDVEMQKHVIGSGGSVEQTIEGSAITLSGTVAQTAVETHEIIDQAGPGLTIHEGFWTPDELSTDVEQPDEVANNTLSNYPNPLKESTTFRFTLEQPSRVTLRVYDMNGSLVNTVLNNQYVNSEDTVPFEAKDQFGAPLSSGSYLYELAIEPETGGRSYSLRNVMVIVK